MDQNLTAGSSMGLNSTAVLESKNVVCSKCGSKVFREALVLKSVSPLYVGGHKDAIVPIPVYICDKCGEPAEGLTDAASMKKIFGEEKSSLTL